MNKRVAILSMLIALGTTTINPVRAQSAPPGGFKTTRWAELVPKDWDPLKQFRNNGLGIVDDGTAQGLRLMREMRATWDNAPTVAEMDGAAVKLPGYVVPIEETKEGMKEFLLVPYFGACIHSPPPPANQIVHVLSAKPLKGYKSMDVVWVSGTMATLRNDSLMGVSGYQLQAAAVERFTGKVQVP